MLQNYAFSAKPPRKMPKICKLSANYHKTSTSIILSTFPQAVPSRTTWRRPLMVRQPYSVAVPSTGGRLHPLPFWKGRGLGSGLRTLPLGRDRWGKYSTVGRLHSLVPEVSVPQNWGNRRGRKDY